MNQQSLVAELHRLEGASEDILVTTPKCLKAACAAAEVGDLNTCRTILDRAISVFSQADLPEISAPLIGLYNELNNHPIAA